MLETESRAEEIPTEDTIVALAKKMIAPYENVVWLIDYEGVLLPKAFSGIQKKQLVSGSEETDAEVEDEVYRLPSNLVFINMLKRLLEAEKAKSSVMKGSSIELLPPAAIRSSIPVFRFGAQRSQHMLEEITEQSLGPGKLHNLGAKIPENSLIVVLNDEMDNHTPPTKLYERIKSGNMTGYDSFDIAEIDLPTFRGERNAAFSHELMESLKIGFNAPAEKRPVIFKSSSGYSQFGSGLGALSGGRKIRRPGD